MTREEAKSIITKLVARFAEHRKEYHLPEYNEQKTRQDFINPFFKALGWDIDNEKGDSEAYREVIYEDKVVVRGKAKAPDYGFRLSGSGKKRLFYVEAKKPSVAIKTNKESAYQLRRYGSSAQAHVSILTNFEDFIVYDCSKVPNLNDSATVARLKYIGFEDYIKEFDFIYDTFSHEAVTKGRFDKFIQGSANKKGTDTLDKRFVQSLDQWRKYLATSFVVNNKKINDEELNYTVQQTIDRLIFLRFCEDRSIEPYGQLQQAASKGNAYTNLLDLFKQADDKYNSGLFDFEKDTITPILKIDNKVIKNVIDELYYPKCNFEFSVMPVEILGNAYEQFLGKVIRITPARGVKIEEKPEVRKAGGVFYTPQYIVDYIVKNTVGKLIDGKTPKEIEKIKIVDPACGSGSFLLGAFEYLLNYHINWYHQKGYADKKGKDNPFTPQGTLTTHEKKHILINNIYGVDLDANAVEVSKLSLLLKCMEGETEASIKQQISLFHERVLPDLDNNVKDGNSLIDTDFYDNEIDLGFEKKIKPFSWKKQFPQVFSPSGGGKGEVGGFDVVIGNPPYVTIGGKEDTLFLKPEVDYLLSRYLSNDYKPNLYAFFYEKALKILKENGLVSFIVPRTFIDNIYYRKLREHFTKNSKIHFLNKINYEVFEDATTGGTFISVFENLKESNPKINCYDINEANEFSNKKPIVINQKEILIGENKSFSFTNPIFQKVLNKIYLHGEKLDFFCSVNNGVNTGNVAKVLLSEKSQGKTYKKILEGKDINRYCTNWKGLWINYDPTIRGRIKLKDLDTKQNKIDFALRDSRIFNTPKIIIRQTSDKIIATLDEKQYISRHSTHCILNDFEPIDLKFLLGILNSKLIDFVYGKLMPEKGKAFAEVKAINVKQLPICLLDSKIKKQIGEEIIKHVDLLLKLNEEIKEEKLPTKIEQLKQRIEYSEEKINQLVYELYELSPEEIKIVEGGSNE
ncbi:MAG: N-6 DNA methylase [Bacteroidetes bacterium]|nr:N-6 DNA methylase [Bacteroidota bacterium]